MQQPHTRARPRLPRWILAILGLLLLFFLTQIGVIFVEVAFLATRPPKTTAFIQRYLSSCLTRSTPCPMEKSWRPLKEISPHLQEAVLIGEDDAFFDHNGIDPEAIQESFELNMKKGRVVRGGSTITQQLAKNLYLSPSKNPFRKMKEILIALFMEKILTKQRILEIYLNVIEWGKGIYGAEAASRFYFGKSAVDLNSEEAAYLAAIIPNPAFYTDPSHARRAARRKGIILRRMGRRSFDGLSFLSHDHSGGVERLEAPDFLEARQREPALEFLRGEHVSVKGVHHHLEAEQERDGLPCS